jgi:hypothetical protein
MKRAARAVPTAPFAVNLTDGSFASSMTRFLNTTLAACAALALSVGSIGAIVTVPASQAAAQRAIALPELA